MVLGMIRKQPPKKVEPIIIEEEVFKDDTRKDKAMDTMQKFVPEPDPNEEIDENFDNIERKTIANIREEEEEVQPVQQRQAPKQIPQKKIIEPETNTISCRIIEGRQMEKGILYTIIAEESIGEIGEEFEMTK